MTDSAAYYVLNVNPTSMDVLHRNPGERCNTDDVVGRQTIDADTADALLTMGEAMKCQHCWPTED